MINKVKDKYLSYLHNSIDKNGEFLFTLNSNPSKFSLLFGIFGLNLLDQSELIEKHKNHWIENIKINLFEYKNFKLNKNQSLIEDKPFLQLLTFSLSALKILDITNDKEIDELIFSIFPSNLIDKLNEMNVDKGYSGSGNFAMFYAILTLNNFDNKLIDSWVNYHTNSMNNHGFWGSHLNHLSFQNGYHQHEIFKYLNIDIPSNIKNNSITHIVNCCDDMGHFAPYPGGGACYDYDAVFMLDYLDKSKNNLDIIRIFKKLKFNLIKEQNIDGGFAENKYVRPFSFIKFLRVLFSSKSISIFFERLKYFIFLIRPKNSKITNHWSEYSRGWNESNLWDSWFRVQTLIIIESYLNPKSKDLGKFIDFPGIGFRKN